MTRAARWTSEDAAKHQAKVRALTLPTLNPAKKLAVWSDPAAARDPTLEKKRSKYGAYRVTDEQGRTYDSKKEMRQFHELLLREKAGEISDLRRQVRFALNVNGIHICDYVADAAWTENGAEVVADTKSEATSKIQSYRIKKKLMLAIWSIEVKEL